MVRSQHSGQVVYTFTRDILPDEELIGNYGPNIGEEVKKLSTNLGFVDENKKEIDQFLQLNIYNMQTVVSILNSIV